MLSGKYISKITIILISVVLVLCVLAMTFYDKLLPVVNNSGYSMEYQEKLFDTSNIIDIDIVMDAEKWDEMLQNARQEKYYECDVVINGQTFKQVGIRPKGNTSLSSIASDPDNDRYSFKIEFDKFVDGQTYFGLDKLVLNNNFSDITNMKEAIFYDMFQFLDADAPLYNYAKISVNGEYFAVYFALEAIEDSFMLRNYGMEKGYLYKPDSMNHNKEKGSAQNGFVAQNNDRKQFDALGKQNRSQSNKTPEEISESQEITDNKVANQKNNEMFEKGGFAGGGRGGGGANLNYVDDNLESYTTIWNGAKNDSSASDHKRIVEALKNINNRTKIDSSIDVDNILKYMAVHNFSVNQDSLSGHMAHNYYLYEANGQINIIPWDYNLAFGGMRSSNASDVINNPIDDSWQGTKLFDFVLENDEYKARYHEYYSRLVNEYLYGGKFDETYNRIRTQIDSLVETDPNAMISYEDYIKGVDVFYDAIMLRAESIKGQLDGTIPSTSEGQKADSSELIDSSGINLSDLGSFMGGNRKNNEMKMPERDNVNTIQN